MIQAPGYYENIKNDPKYDFDPIYRPFQLRWLQGFATISMSYICHPLFFNVRRELIENNPRRIKKIIFVSIFFEMSIYLAIVIAGYVSLGNNFQVPVFTQRPNYDKNNNDIMMVIARVAFITVVLTCIPVNMYPCREQIMSFYRIKDTKKNHFFLVFGLTLSAFGICIGKNIIFFYFFLFFG